MGTAVAQAKEPNAPQGAQACEADSDGWSFRVPNSVRHSLHVSQRCLMGAHSHDVTVSYRFAFQCWRRPALLNPYKRKEKKNTKAKFLHCMRTACILRTQGLGYSPKNTYHLSSSTAKQQSPHENNENAFKGLQGRQTSTCRTTHLHMHRFINV